MVVFLCLLSAFVAQGAWGQDEATFSPAWESGTVDLTFGDKSVRMLSHEEHGVTHYPNLGNAVVEWKFVMGDCKVAHFWCDDASLDAGDELVTGNTGDGHSRIYQEAGETFLFYQDFFASFTSKWSIGDGDPVMHGLECYARCADFTSRDLHTPIAGDSLDLAQCSTFNDGDGLYITSHEGVTLEEYESGSVGQAEYNFDAAACPGQEGILNCDFVELARNGDVCEDSLTLDGVALDDVGAEVPATWVFTGRTSICELPPGVFHDLHHDTLFVGQLKVTFNEGAGQPGQPGSRVGFACAAACMEVDVPSCNQLTVLVLGHDFEPVQGATVSVSHGTSGDVLTGPEGLSHFYIDEDEVIGENLVINVVDPSSEHYDIRNYPVALDASGRTSVTITLTRVVQVILQVLSARDGQTPEGFTVDAWETHGVHCPDDQCSQQQEQDGRISFFFPAGPPFLTVEVRHRLHKTMDFGVIVPAGENSVTVECPVILAPTMNMELNIRFVDGALNAVPDIKLTVDGADGGTADGDGNLVLSLATPDAPGDQIMVELEACDDAKTKCGQMSYIVTAGKESDSVDFAVQDVLDVNVGFVGIDTSWNELGPLSGVGVKVRQGEVVAIEAPKTGADGKAKLKLVGTVPGGLYTLDVDGYGVPGYTQVGSSGAPFFRPLDDTEVELTVSLMRTCDPAWEGVAVEQIRFNSDSGPATMQLSLTQKRRDSECTQPDQACDKTLTELQVTSNHAPVTDRAYLHATFDGSVYVSVNEMASLDLQGYDGYVELLNGNGNTVAHVVKPDSAADSSPLSGPAPPRKPPRHSASWWRRYWQRRWRRRRRSGSRRGDGRNRHNAPSALPTSRSASETNLQEQQHKPVTPAAARSEWSVGCIDMNTKKFYCLNVVGLGDKCADVTPQQK